MFCPKCAAQNVDGASFCRACGANVSLVPQALTGQLPTAQPDEHLDRDSRRRRGRHREKDPPSLEKGIINISMGVGFLIAGLAVMFKFPGGFTWGWALFIPGFSTLGRGIAMIVSARAKERQQMQSAPVSLGPFPPRAFLKNEAPPHLADNRPRNTNDLLPPVPSVTEGTTRHLGAEAPTRHFDSVTGEEKVR